MKRNNLGKFLLVIALVGLSLSQIYPPNDRPLFDEFKSRAVGVDTNFTAIVDRAAKLEADAPTQTFNNLLAAIGTNDVTRYFPRIELPNSS